MHERKIHISFGCRTKKPVWGCFESYVEGKSRRAKCIYCGHSLQAQPDKMLDHIIRRCTSIPALLRSVWKKSEDYESQERAVLPASVTTKLDELLTKNPIPVKQKAKYYEECGISGPFNHQLSDQIIDRIHDDIVIALITSSVPLSFVNNPFFRRAFDRLAGGMKHIDEHYAKTIVFNRVHEKVMQEMMRFIEASHSITVICRSFPNITGTSTTSFILVNDSNRSELLHKMKGSIASDADKVFKSLMVYAKALSKEMTDNNKIMFCADASNISSSMRQILKTEQVCPFSLVGSCMINQSNLFLRDLITVTPAILYTIDNVIKLALFIRKSAQFNTTVLNALVNDVGIEVGTLPLSIPSLTHLYSIGIMVKQVLDLQNVIVRVMATEKSKAYIQQSKLAIKVLTWVGDDGYWKGIRELHHFLKPFNILTEMCTREFPTSGQILCLWMWLIIIVNTTKVLTPSVISTLNKIFIQRIHNYAEDHYFACYLLHPAIRGAGLSAIGKQHAQKSIYSVATRISPVMDMPKLMFQLSNYINKTGVFFSKSMWMDGLIKNAKGFWARFSFIRELQLIANQVINYRPLVLLSDNNWKFTVASIAQKEKLHKLSVQNAFKKAQISHHYRYENVPSSSQEVHEFKKLFTRPDVSPQDDSPTSAQSKSTQPDDADGILNYNHYDPVATMSLENILEYEDMDNIQNNRNNGQVKETTTNMQRLTLASALEKLTEEKITIEQNSLDSDQFCIKQFSIEWLNCNETGLSEINEALNNMMNG